MKRESPPVRKVAAAGRRFTLGDRTASTLPLRVHGAAVAHLARHVVVVDLASRQLA